MSACNLRRIKAAGLDASQAANDVAWRVAA
jgi:hypothetical protein